MSARTLELTSHGDRLTPPLIERQLVQGLDDSIAVLIIRACITLQSNNRLRSPNGLRHDGASK